MTIQQVSGKKLELRCFLEGIEVPCTSAATQINFDAPATCVAQCIPTQSCTRLKPRTSIHIFYKELTDLQEDYRVFFIGEVVGYQFSKTPASLSISYQCVDDSSYWDSAYQYYTDYGRGADWLFQKKSSFMGVGTGLFDSLFREHASVIGSLLRSRPRSYPRLKGLLAGVVNILEKVGGAGGSFKGFNDFFTMAELRRKVLAQVSASELDTTSARIYSNKVFWKWLMRRLSSVGSMVSIRDMIKLLFQYIFHNVVPNPIAKYDPPGKKNVTRKSIKVLNTKAGKRAHANLGKVKGMLDRYFAGAVNFFGHSTETARTAVIHVVEQSGSGMDASVRTTQLTATASILKAYKAAVKPMEALFRKANKLLKEAESGTGSVSGLAGKIKAARGHLAKAKKVAQNHVAFINKESKRSHAFEEYFWRHLFTNLGPYEEQNRFEMRPSYAQVGAQYKGYGRSWQLYDSNTGVRLDNAGRSAAAPTPFLRTPPVAKRVSLYLNKMQEAITDAMVMLGSDRASLTLLTDRTKRERLHNQVMRPDVWFVSPPKCNVLFPEDYISFQYQRNFMREVTRMELTTAMEFVGSNFITNSRYFSPNIEDITGKYVLQSAKAGVRLIMPHEIFTGILPKFEFMSEANVFAGKADQSRAFINARKQLLENAKYLQDQLKALTKNQKKSDADTQAAMAEYSERIKKLRSRASDIAIGGVPYIQKAVNYLFFKARFSARALSIGGHFTPRIVAGFPGLVISHPKTAIHTAPPHFLGMVASLSHVVSQEGGASNQVFTTSREHGGQDDDFLDIDGGATQNIRIGGKKLTHMDTKQLDKSLRRLHGQIHKLRNSSTKASKTALSRAEKELKEALAKADFIINYEKLRVRYNGKKPPMSGLRGPNGGPVVDVRTKDPDSQRFPGTKSVIVENLQAKAQLQKYEHDMYSPLTNVLGGKPISSKITLDQAQRQVELREVRAARARKGLPSGLQFARRYVIVEEFQTVRRKITLPTEEQIYPSWLAPVYRNELIGAKTVKKYFQGVYHQFYGCGAITDDVGSTREGRKEFDAIIKDPASANKRVFGHLKPGKTIEEAVDELAAAYETARKQGLDIHTFIRNYTQRPIATLQEILGSDDLTVSEKGERVAGTLGFHSLAFGDYQNLEGFSGVKSSVRYNRGPTTSVAQGLDTRRKKRQAVLRYRSELDKGTGQLGG